MSIFVDYRSDAASHRNAQRLRVEDISRFALSTSIFTGDQIFLIDGHDFSFVGYNIPLLEFARALVLSIDELQDGADQALSHPLDIDERLAFSRTNSSVTLSSTLTGDTSLVSMDELSQAIRNYGRRVLSDFLVACPAAKDSRDLFDWYPVHSLGLEYLFTQ
jgi:hypothetical protein